MKYADLAEQYANFPEIDRQEVLKLVDWIRIQPHIQNLNESEALQFFHACHGSMETTKKVLDLNLTMRTHVTELFSNLDIDSDDLKRAMRTITVIPLPGFTHDGYRVMLSKLSDPNASNYSFADTMKLYCMMFDFWMHEDGIRAGHHIVIDLKGCTLGHIARVGIMQLKKFLYYVQDAAALRLMGFHFINIVPFMDKILALMNPFMKKELANILHMHSNMEEFYKFVPKELLPHEYGGSEQPIEIMKEIYYKKMRDNRQNMLEFEKRHQVNEKLRPGKPKNASDLFGIEGNFKKLDLD